MLDSEIAKELMQNGGIVSNGEFVYLPMRLTGTGTTERIGKDGLAYTITRKLEDFSKPEWMEQYANTPILLTHPKNENGDAVRADLENGCFVGNTIASYIKENEIWVIAKLFDETTLNLLLDRAKQGLPISTSPHFVSDNLTQEGSDVFLEAPTKLNHLAIVERGFWDKKSATPPIDLGDGEIKILKGGSMEEQTQEKQDSIMEQEVISTPEEEAKKADSENGEVAERVADLEEHEAKEAESFKELAKEHQNLDKGDSMDVDKRKLIDEILAIATKPNDEFKGGEEEKFNTLLGLVEKDSYNPSESGKSDECDDKHDEEPKDEPKDEKQDEEEKDKSDSLVSGDYCDEDKQRDSVMKRMHSLSDYAKVPYVGGRVKAWKLQKEFAKSNLDLVDEKYLGLIDKIDSSTASLSNEMFESMVKKIEEKREIDLKKGSSNQFSLFRGKFKNR